MGNTVLHQLPFPQRRLHTWNRISPTLQFPFSLPRAAFGLCARRSDTEQGPGVKLSAQVTGHQLTLTWPLLMNWLRDRMGFPLILTSLLNAFWHMTEHFRLYYDVHNFHYEDQTTKNIVMITKNKKSDASPWMKISSARHGLSMTGCPNSSTEKEDDCLLDWPETEYFSI